MALLSFAVIALVLILARAIAELLLSRLNQRHVHTHADEVPPPFREMVDEPTYRRSVDYTLAKSRFGEVVTLFDAVLLIGILFSGILPWVFEKFTAAFGTSVLAMAGFLFATGVALSINQFAIRVVRAIQTRRPIRFQHNYREDMGNLIV